MLTRLKVSGFKNLVDVDVRFGPFTCVAGPNGVGKSNLFDAIWFLSMLADHTLIDAALAVRKGERTNDIRSLFHCVRDEVDPEMSLEAEMIFPLEGVDDLGSKATASITFLRYSVGLRLRRDDAEHRQGPLELVREQLSPIRKREARGQLRFPHSPDWRKSVIQGKRSGKEFISTENKEGRVSIKFHQDKGGGRPSPFSASDLPRTLLSTAKNAAESPTAVLARREMQSWRMLQLEPAALRKPDDFSAPARLDANGAHLPSTLRRLQREAERAVNGRPTPDVCARVSNRLAELIDGVREIKIDEDEKRELLTLILTDSGGTRHPARALSDGTLRFLALAILREDPESQGVICLEEPENGIHPSRIPAMIRLLREIAADPKEACSLDNPLRQVILNTHSPIVVGIVEAQDLIVAELRDTVRDGRRFNRAHFGMLADTWRADAIDERLRSESVCPVGKLLSMLGMPYSEEEPQSDRGVLARVRKSPHAADFFGKPFPPSPANDGR